MPGCFRRATRVGGFQREVLARASDPSTDTHAAACVMWMGLLRCWRCGADPGLFNSKSFYRKYLLFHFSCPIIPLVEIIVNYLELNDLHAEHRSGSVRAGHGSGSAVRKEDIWERNC